MNRTDCLLADSRGPFGSNTNNIVVASSETVRSCPPALRWCRKRGQPSCRSPTLEPLNMAHDEGLPGQTGMSDPRLDACLGRQECPPPGLGLAWADRNVRPPAWGPGGTGILACPGLGTSGDFLSGHPAAGPFRQRRGLTRPGASPRFPRPPRNARENRRNANTQRTGPPRES